MSDGESFLARWARRKREAAEETRAPEPAARDAQHPATDERETTPALKPAPAPPEEEAFDLSKLPPIESITAETDIRAFLAAGVPAELARAALRRAWVADPAIRDFVGIAENQWDFTTPGGAPGFGPLEASEELRRLVARIVGDRPEEPEGETEAPETENKDVPASSGAAASIPEVEPAGLPAAPDEPVIDTLSTVGKSNNRNAALQYEDPATGFPKPRGGGALPR